MKMKIDVVRWIILLTFPVPIMMMDHALIIYMDRINAFQESLGILEIIHRTRTDSNLLANVSMTIFTYERSIQLEMSHSNGFKSVKLNYGKADVFSRASYYTVALVIRQELIFETYTDCELMDSYSFQSDVQNKIVGNDSIYLTMHSITNNARNMSIVKNESLLVQLPDCSNTDSSSTNNFNRIESSRIDLTALHKMQQFIHHLHSNETSSNNTIDSLTIIYRLNMEKTNIKSGNIKIFNVPQLSLRIEYDPEKNFVEITIDQRPIIRSVLYAHLFNHLGKSYTDSHLIIYMTPKIIEIYIDCQLIDKEYTMNEFVFQELIRKLSHEKSMDYKKNLTMVVFNETIDQTAKNLHCTRLRRTPKEILPAEIVAKKSAIVLNYFFRRFENLVESSNEMLNVYRRQSKTQMKIKSDGSSMDTNLTTTYEMLNNSDARLNSKLSDYGENCSNDDECSLGRNTSMICRTHCRCPDGLFWSKRIYQCLFCDGFLIGSRCFYLTNETRHWSEAHEFCQTERRNTSERVDSIMRLASNLTMFEIQQLKDDIAQQILEEPMITGFWIGASSFLDTKQSRSMTRRQLHSADYYWYDNEEILEINVDNLWCSKNSTRVKQERFCLAIMNCGLKVNDCHESRHIVCEIL